MSGPPTKRLCHGLHPEPTCGPVTHRFLQRKYFLMAIFNGVRRMLTDTYGLARMTRWSDNADWDRTQLNLAATYILELLMPRELVDQVTTAQYTRPHTSVSQSPYVKILPAHPRHLVLVHPKRQADMNGLGGVDIYAFEAPGYLVTTIEKAHEHLGLPLPADSEIVDIPIEYGTDYESLFGGPTRAMRRCSRTRTPMSTPIGASGASASAPDGGIRSQTALLSSGRRRTRAAGW